MEKFRPNTIWLKGRKSHHQLQINRENEIKMVPIPAAIMEEIPTSSARLARLLCPAGGGLQQLRQVLFPESRLSGGAVADCLVAAGDQQHAAVFHTLDLAFQYPEFRWIALVVR